MDSKKSFLTVLLLIVTLNCIPAQETAKTVPDTLPAAEISSLVLDVHVYQFHVTFVKDGAYYDYALTGNGVYGEVKDIILTLPSGTRVWFEDIRRKEDDGSERIAPPVIYVVK